MPIVLEYRIRADEDYYVAAYARYRRQHWWYRWLRPAGVLGIALVTLIYFSKGALADWLSIGLFLFLLLGAASIFPPHWTMQFPAAAYAKSRHSTTIG